MPIINPDASRTLDPTGRSFKSVVGLHDHNLSDADINLIQALQDSKNQSALANEVCSGVLSYSPFVFSARTVFPQSLQFTVPAFSAIMNGEILTIGGQFSASLTNNVVRIPAPSFWSQGSTSPAASLYIVFIEFWYQQINPLTGLGYQTINGLNYIYPNGCVNAVASNLISNDVIDPFAGNETTERTQLQWAIRAQPVDLSYDFSKYAFGLDAGAIPTAAVYSQAGQTAPQSGATYQFTNMGAINGDSGLWRSGDGNVNNALATLDGYSYAIPMAVVFQRNTGVYSPKVNPLGTASSLVSQSGTLATGVTGRFDGKYADVIYPEDVIDTRAIVSLTGWNESSLVQTGFADIVSGNARLALARGQTPGNVSIAAGSMLDYAVSLSPAAIDNTDSVGSFDGYRNGISGADYTSYVCKAVTIEQKTNGALGSNWQQGDSFTITLPSSSPATIEYLLPQGLVFNPVTGVSSPVLFLAGQVQITGLGTKVATVQFIKNLTGTSYDPGINPIYVTIGVEYAPNSGVDLGVIPNKVWGGTINDADSGSTLPVFGVSSYEVTASLPTVTPAHAYNPNYSNTIFGTRVQVLVQNGTSIIGANSTDTTGNPITTFTLNRTAIGAQLTGLYVVSAIDQVSGLAYYISQRTITGNSFSLVIQGTIPTTSTLVLTFIAAATAQLSYTAPIKAVTQIEETVLVGNATDATLPMDARVAIVSNSFTTLNTIVLATTNALLTSIAGDDVNQLIWVANTSGGGYSSVQISSAVFANGFVTLTVPSTVNLQTQTFFLVAGITPAFNPASTLILTQTYVPYQGEGVPNRDYEIVYAEDSALVTTNGTGTAPIPGLRDVYPYNRAYPIVSALPSQVSWSDSDLSNQPVASMFDSNFVAKAFENVEHTLRVPCHTNDFIKPFNDGARKSLQLVTPSGGRGFAKAEPHLGFAIEPVTPRTTVGQDVTSTVAAVTIFVDNVNGNDSNDGQTPQTAFLTIGAAINSLPGTLRHPCSVQLIPTGTSYLISALQSSLQVAALGDGTIREAKYYALAVITSPVQASGRLVITAQAGTTEPVVIDATGFAGFGDGPTSAFFVNNTRVIFNQLTFQGFTDPAVKGLAADIEFVDCTFISNLTSGSFEQGSTVIVDGGSISLANGGNGFIASASTLTASGVTFIIQSSANAGYFFEASRSSNLELDTHSNSLENNITASDVVASAELNSSIVVGPDFSSAGQCNLATNSVLSRTVTVNPFLGGVVSDSSSNVVTSL